MERNKTPGPDGFPAEFYQVDLMALFHDFHKGERSLFSLNFGVITLLLKCQKAIKIQQYVQICLLNVNIKIFTKVATNRINLMAQKVIRPPQITFLPGRYILEGVTILYETIHELHKVEVDFEKAHDKVK
jgi:hypothetical protein